MRADKDHDDTIFLCVSPSGSAGLSTSLAETVSSGFPPFLTPLRKDGDLAAVSGVVETGDGTGCASTVGGLAGESSICTRASCRTRACCRPSPIRLVDAGGAGKSVACHGRVCLAVGHSLSYAPLEANMHGCGDSNDAYRRPAAWLASISAVVGPNALLSGEGTSRCARRKVYLGLVHGLCLADTKGLGQLSALLTAR